MLTWNRVCPESGERSLTLLITLEHWSTLKTPYLSILLTREITEKLQLSHCYMTRFVRSIGRVNVVNNGKGDFVQDRGDRVH